MVQRVVAVSLLFTLIGCGDGGGAGGGGGGTTTTGGEAGAGAPSGGSGAGGAGGEGASGDGGTDGGSAGATGGAGTGGDDTGGTGGAGQAGDGGAAGDGIGGTSGASSGGNGGGGAGMGGAGAGMGAAAGSGGNAGTGASGGSAGSGGGPDCPRGYTPSGSSCVPNTCEGAPDPDCACLFVTPDGDDGQAAASGGLLAFRNVQPAIDFADAQRSGPRKVCVVQGATCSAIASYSGPAGSDLTMRDGISLYGGYESTTLTRCSAPGGVTLRPGSAAGIVFGSSVMNPTVLDRFVVERFSAATSTGITFDGATEAAVVDVEIGAAPGATTAIGVEAKNGADAVLTRVRMPGVRIGDVFFSAPNQIGFRSVGSRLSVTGSSVTFMSAPGEQTFQGIWIEDSPGSSIENTSVRIYSGGDGTASGIVVMDSAGFVFDGSSIRLPQDEGRARRGNGASFVGVPGLSWVGGTLDVLSQTSDYALLVENSPNASIDVSARVFTSSLFDGGIVLRGDVEGTELLGSVEAEAGPGPGLVIDGRDGGALAVETSVSARASASESIDAIRVTGDCYPTISSTVTITNSTTNRAQVLNGILCSDASRCSIEGSTVRLLGASTLPGAVITATGIRCGSGNCPTLTDNDVSGLSQPGELRNSRYSGGGVVAPGATLVSRNRIAALCSGGGGVGLVASGRIENNVISGPTCGGSFLDVISNATGLVVTGDADVHSNTIFGGGATDGVFFGQVGCRSTGVLLQGGVASLRNNIVSAQTCNERRAVVRDPAASAPNALQNNDLHSAALYVDGSTFLTSVASVNALPGAANNFSADPLLDAEFRLLTGSPCIDTGTASGAPLMDFDGDARGPSPDVGADERACPSGYRPEGTGCVDIDECATNHGGCDPLVTCTNVPGSRTCGACPPGTIGSGETGCTPAVSCSPNPCEHGGVCSEGGGSYACACPLGNPGRDCELELIELDLGRAHACGLLSDGTSACWGSNASAYVPSGTFGQVVAQYDYSCALALDGQVACYGSPPTPIPSSAFRTLAAGTYHVCGVRLDGTVQCWGFNSQGQATPPAGTFRALSAGVTLTCGIRTDDTLACWGQNFYGSALPPAGGFSKVAVGDFHGCAIAADQTLACWGYDSSGQATPPSGTFVELSANGNFTCGIRTNGSIACWGDSTSGALNPPSGSFVTLSANRFNDEKRVCAVRTDGTLTCWGS
jgi:hypothetical protein